MENSQSLEKTLLALLKLHGVGNVCGALSGAISNNLTELCKSNNAQDPTTWAYIQDALDYAYNDFLASNSNKAEAQL